MLTLKAALELAGAAIGRTDAQVLAAHLLGVNSAYLAAHPMRVLTESEDARLDSMVARRALGHPVAYLVGTREFYSRDFAVGPEVLIPRPETETLVEAVLAVTPIARPVTPGAATAVLARGPITRPVTPGAATAELARGPITLLDLGTGSGAIAVTLACERPDVRVTATDASREALEVARRNARAHGCALELLEGSWYDAVAGRRFDLIVSNPPYVAHGDPHLSEGDLRFEPARALTDGSGDGLGSIRAIVAGAPSHLKPGGWLVLEHGYDQAAAVARLLAAAGLEEIGSVRDLAGIERVARARRA